MRPSALSFCFSGGDLQQLLALLVENGLSHFVEPSGFYVDSERQKPGLDWWKSWPPQLETRDEITAEYGEWDWISLTKDLLALSSSEVAFERDVLADWLAQLPFELMSTDWTYDEWDDLDVPPVGFGDGHFSHGFACAFKGAGHDRLVSRRWLDFGPWRTVKGPQDTTFVQFHDFQADPALAAEQAKPGHERMGISDVGGFIQQDYVYSTDLSGFYDEAVRVLKIVVYGRELAQREMLDACALRFYQALGPTKPLDNVAYVFMEGSEAERHLHELWLRELECWAIRDGREVRLDQDYNPAPKTPAWAR